jgi:hypothetical protein
MERLSYSWVKGILQGAGVGEHNLRDSTKQGAFVRLAGWRSI